MFVTLPKRTDGLRLRATRLVATYLAAGVPAPAALG
jgi:hypothetical protein